MTVIRFPGDRFDRHGDFEAAMERWLNAYFDAEDLILENMKAANAAKELP